MSRVSPSRQAAYEVIRLVAEQDAYSNLILPKVIDDFNLDSRDAGFATELALGTLRWVGLIDEIITVTSGRDIDRIDPPVRDALRLGIYQVLFMRVPDHAAVNNSVDLCSAIGYKSASGLVNAVLRKVCAQPLEYWREEIVEGVEDPLERLARRWSHPRWIVSALRDALAKNKNDIEKLLEVDNLAPAVTGVTRSGQAGLDELFAAGGVEGRWAPTAASIVVEPRSIAAVRRGRVGVQDEGSQLVALAFANAPLQGSDVNWLDLCAGPGGKAALLKSLVAEHNGHLTAVELQPHRAELVHQALTGVEGKHDTVVADGRDEQFATGKFDRVIVDAPCTGLGVIRRRAESRWRRTPADVGTLTKLQRELLTNALKAVRPGGIVGYATCSPHLAETEFIVEDVLAANPEARLLNAAEIAATIPGLHHQAEFAESLGEGPFMRLWPHIHSTDGMFLAILTRD